MRISIVAHTGALCRVQGQFTELFFNLQKRLCKMHEVVWQAIRICFFTQLVSFTNQTVFCTDRRKTRLILIFNGDSR